MLNEAGAHRIVLKDVDRFKQRSSSRRFTPSLHLHQRTILILERLALSLVQPPHQVLYSLFSSDLHPHRQRVDEQSHHPLDPLQPSTSSRHRRTKDHIPLTAVTAHHHRPRSLHHCVQRHLPLPRHLFQPSARLRTQPHVLFFVFAFLSS